MIDISMDDYNPVYPVLSKAFFIGRQVLFERMRSRDGGDGATSPVTASAEPMFKDSGFSNVLRQA